MGILDEEDHIYKQTLELANQSGFNIQPIKTVEEFSATNVQETSSVEDEFSTDVQHEELKKEEGYSFVPFL